MKNITTSWEFVEKYFPNYYSHDEILRNNDLTKRIEEGEEGLQQDLNDSNAYVFEKAIEGYIESLKVDNDTDKFAVYWSVEDFEAKAKSMFEDLKDSEPMEFSHLDNWEQFYDKTKFPEQLEKMINNHDANDGITWLTVEEYVGTCEIRKNTNE